MQITALPYKFGDNKHLVYCTYKIEWLTHVRVRALDNEPVHMGLEVQLYSA